MSDRETITCGSAHLFAKSTQNLSKLDKLGKEYYRARTSNNLSICLMEFQEYARRFKPFERIACNLRKVSINRAHSQQE